MSSTEMDRRVMSGLKALGERVVPLEQACRVQDARHEVIVKKLDDVSTQLKSLDEKVERSNDRCDDLNLRVTVVETAWREQMRPGLERLRSLELKVAGAGVIGGALAAIAAELIKAVVK